jgi:type IX secretion system substrate protein
LIEGFKMKRYLLLFVLFLVYTTEVFAFTGEGYGYIDDPYQITTVQQLQEMQDELTAHYILMNDIDATETKDWNELNIRGFKPVGEFDNDDAGKSFTGSLDGKDFTINKLYCKSQLGYPNAGLFGSIADGCTIKNVHIVEAQIDGIGYYSGGSILAGFVFAKEANTDILIENCSTSGIVNGRGGFVGKLTSLFGGITVRNCYSTASVNCDNSNVSSGGFCGDIVVVETGEILVEYCYSIGDVVGGSGVGGFVGSISTNNGEIKIRNSFSRGSATATSRRAGGFIGHCATASGEEVPILIENCYSTGKVTSDVGIGGFLGYNVNDHKITIENCYWDRQTSGIVTSLAGTGKTTTDMMKQSTYENWDFENIWSMNPNTNDGYPFLQDVHIVSVANGFEDEVSFLIYPNPTSDFISIKSDVNIIGIQIVDITGNVVKEIHKNGNGKLDRISINNLSSGFYNIRLFSKNRSYIKPFVINK